MSLESIRQTAEAIKDTTKKYEDIYSKKEQAIESLTIAKTQKNSKRIRQFTDQLVSLDYNLSVLKRYIITLITNLKNIVDEEKNAL